MFRRRTDPAFELQAPDVENVNAEERPLVRELRNRYESAASEAVGAWQSVDTIRANLVRDPCPALSGNCGKWDAGPRLGRHPRQYCAGRI
jgi:hypothetical protein